MLYSYNFCMKENNEISCADPKNEITSECQSPEPKSVGFHFLDILPFETLPEPVRRQNTYDVMCATVTALFAEGGRGPAAKRLLSRDCVLGKNQLRYLQSIFNVELSSYLKNGGDSKRVELLERLVESQHRRMLASLNRLGAMDTNAASKISVSARYAQINSK